MPNVTYYEDPFPHIIIEDTFLPREYDMMLTECEYYRKAGYLFAGNSSGGSAHEGKSIKNNVGIFPADLYKFQEYSPSAALHKNILHDGILNEQFKKSWAFRPCVKDSKDEIIVNVLINYYETSMDYPPHRDTSVVSMITYINKEPKQYTGGELYFPEFDNYEITPKNNMTILFPSNALHAVKKVESVEGYGRWGITAFIGISKEPKGTTS